MDLVYIYKTPEDGSDMEIMYSLRSAEKNLKFRKVFIIGDRPKGLQGIVHIDYRGAPSKFENGVSRILYAAHQERITDDFILMNDDFFILKPHETIPYYWTQTIRTYIKKHPMKSAYMAMVKKSAEILGNDAKMFQAHFPIVYNKKKLRILEGKYNLPNGISLRTLYCNEFGIEGERLRVDFKARDAAQLQRYSTKPFISTTNDAARSSMFKKIMAQKFPDRSRFEIVPSREGSYFTTRKFEYGGKHFGPGEMVTIQIPKSLAIRNKMTDANGSFIE